MEIYAKSSVRRWKKAIRECRSGPIRVFSPYVTSTTAETVLGATENVECEVYTIFSAGNFANGSSSLSCLEKLRSLGCKLFHLPNLHAKVFLIGKEFASVGSQNLTAGGTRNLEVTVILDEEEAVSQVERAVLEWCRDAQAISPEMIAEMRAKIVPRKRKIDKMKAELGRLNEEIQKNETSRVEAERRRKELEQQRLQELHQTVQELSKRSAWKKGVVDYVSQRRGWGNHTLINNAENFLEWTIDGEDENLRKTYRYLTLIKDTGKLGWARINKTRITQFGKEVSFTSPFLLYGRYWKVSFEAIWDSPQSPTSNVSVKLRIWGGDQAAGVDVDCWCSLRSIEIESVKEVESLFEEARAASYELKEALETSPSEFQSTILKRLLEPFKYEKNLFGVEAKNFFGSSRSKWEIQLVKVKGFPLLVAHRRYW